MTVIVLNTLTGAVTEYDWAFQSLTPSHAGGADGLATLGGDTDAGEEIEGEIRSGMAGGEAKLKIASVYVAVKGDASSTGIVRVQGESGAWEYPMPVRATGVSRQKTGRGILENYLGIGYRNADGADFLISRLEGEITATNQRSI